MKVQYTWLSQSLCILFLTFKYNIYKFIWVLLWLSSVCWVRTLNTPKWDILTTDVAVYFGSKFSKLKLQSISPGKARKKPLKPTMRIPWVPRVKEQPHPKPKQHKTKGAWEVIARLARKTK